MSWTLVLQICVLLMVTSLVTAVLLACIDTMRNKR